VFPPLIITTTQNERESDNYQNIYIRQTFTQ
jgi:hypothetical protein